MDFHARSMTGQPSHSAGRGRGRGRGLGLGDTRRETVEAAAARSRIARRKAAAKAAAASGASLGSHITPIIVDDGALDDDKDDEGDLENDAPDVGHDPDAPIFADAPYDDDDREADGIYEAVEERMRARRLKHTEARIQRELLDYRKQNPSVPQQFVDLKRKLADISENDWAALPDVGDRSVQRKKIEKITPAPDFLLQSALSATSRNAVTGSASEYGLNPNVPTHDSAGPSTGETHGKTDLAKISEGRSSVIVHNLDTASDSVTGQTNIDPAGYLTQMAGMHITSDTEVSDIKKARLLLKSVTSTNPKHAPGWIAAARLEEVAGKLAAARALAAEACHYCPCQEDVWLEAARLHPPHEAKSVLADAVKYVPKSVKIWLQAAALENDLVQKKRVLRRALQIIPTSAKLWRVLVDLEEPQNARVLLSHAVECVPSELDLWLGLARLESYQNAKSVLNRALQHLQAEPALWITGAKLEEANLPSSEKEEGFIDKEVSTVVQRPILRAVQSLSIDDDIVKRERWLEEAFDAERTGFPATCRAIISASICVGIEEFDRLRVWQDGARCAENKGAIECAREIYRVLSRSFPGDEEVWRKFAEFESRAGNVAGRRAVLDAGMARCPRAEVLWLMAAKELWKDGCVEDTRVILARAYQANPNSEAILLAAAKVEAEARQDNAARALLAKARKNAPSARVYMKSALLERCCGNREAEADLLEQGLDRYPTAEKLWLMMAQWHERWEQSLAGENHVTRENCKEIVTNLDGRHGDAAARSTYNSALRQCPHAIAIWLGLARLEERSGSVTKARAILESARLACKQTVGVDRLWEESVRIDMRSSSCSNKDGKDSESSGVSGRVDGLAVSRTAFETTLSRALKECGESGRLWALSIALEPKARQRAKSVDALKRCDQDPLVLLQIGKLFWRERKLEKARDWLKRAIKADSSFGDAYAALHAFERSFGSPTAIGILEEEVKESSPKYGDVWIAIRKAPGNEYLTVVDVLRKVSQVIPSSL